MIDDKILKAFKTRPDDYVSGEELSALLKISRTAIWKHIEKLRKDGYRVDAVPHLGYRLVSVPDKMLSSELRSGLSTKIIGKKILSYESTDSTNLSAYKIAEEGAEEGTVVVAEAQTKGRGRLGRKWISPKNVGVYLSCILRPAILPLEVPKITLVVAVAAVKAIRECSGLKALIRWPNDILINNKKVCGILTEMKAEQDATDFIVVGIGINANTLKKDLPKEATSLKEERGSRLSRVNLARILLEQLEHYYLLFKKEGFEKIIDEWHNFSGILGSRVKVLCQKKETEGLVQDVDNTGALIIRLDNGLQERVLAGDLKILR